ncbi:hypothetical protein Zmor_006452 [Zophobas morio]|uniref:Uncharacterized protein n=1 Tax=Zophobas morio TaxID=2755281 RepID=A0AA38MMT5_9CUCU|nr:hypothetical protein Zmor_006452 [Zophobas morio]
MSQFYNLPNQTTVNNDESNRNNECWVDLLENLAVFIAAASNLIKSLQQTIELSKLQTSEGFDKDFLCACAKLSENIAGLSMKDTGFLNQINTEMVPTANKLMEGEVKKNEENNLVESTEKEDCMCVDSSSESKGAEKSSKLKIQSKSKLGKKQPKEICKYFLFMKLLR